ncbi:HlyB/MsbA family ABC transporter [Parapedobacter defluvii]|uniref:HlyB/MsbA family ABC transporter n=1 Tax=Parapedobacter defluvii TaxID=2045106 RepID=A0ABQ1MX99_9SPHI|nr:ABC transporter ATP-binding protein [Parapedobacter defluvii]GGC48755.1 HlyB/MsbA family ABC transporter [Parapedobacter defluvii]
MLKSKLKYYKDATSKLQIGRTLKLVWEIEPYKTIWVVFSIILSNGMLFLSLYTMKLLIDVVSSHQLGSLEYGTLVIRHVLIAGGAAVLHAMSNSLSAYISELQSTIVSEKIDDMIHQHTVKLDMAYYEDPEYFNTLKLAKEAGGGRPNAVIMGLLDVLSGVLKIVAASVVIFTIDWRLLPILVLFILPMFIVRIHFSRKYNALRIRNTPTERLASYFSHLITSEISAREIRSYNLGEYFKKKYFDIRTDLIGERLKISLQRTKAESGFNAIASLGFFTCIYFIARGAIDGRVSPGDIAIFLVIFPMIFGYLREMTSGITAVYSNNLYVKYIFELFDLKSSLHEIASPQAIPGSPHVKLKVDDLSFRYPHADKLILNGISLEISPGKIVALVGLNGSGKSTLIKLLARLYDPTEGTIRLDGLDIRNFSIADYRKQVSIVFQDFYKYNTTANENIFLGDIDRKEHLQTDIESAAKQAGAHDFIKDLELRYQTMMGRVFEGGHEISIGQWQKLATARAFYSPAKFLILDEATSALDAQSEYKLFDMLKANLGNRGALIISHRYSTIKHADYVYVLSEGRIVQQGSPEMLSGLKGVYADLFKTDILQERDNII